MMEYIQPQTIMIEASFSLIRLFKLMAFVMANQRSTVIITKVNTDKWLANTVRKPAALQPEPVKKIFDSVEILRFPLYHPAISPTE